jgi:hypothetical protein
MNRYTAQIAACLGLAACVATAKAQPHGDSGTWSFIVDNDALVGTDNRYTNGLRLSWLAPEAERGGVVSTRLRDALDKLPFIGQPGKRHSAALTLTQVIVTPDDLAAPELLRDQAPYYGHLALGLMLYAWDDNEFHLLGASLGVVGPDSSADRTQREIHRWLGARQPQGWQHQVGRRTTADLTYLQGVRLANQRGESGLGSDLTLNYGATLGSPETSAGVGAVWRWGRHLPRNFNAYFAGGGGEGALLSLSNPPAEAGWFVYGGAVGTLVAYNTIERATRQTHNFSSRAGFASLIIGAAAYRGGLHFGLSLQTDSAPVHQDKRPITYGSLYLAWTP